MLIEQKTGSLAESLRAPFPTSYVEWRVGRVFNVNKAVMLPYITARGIQERLDNVFGIEGWSSKFEIIPDYGVICTIKAGDIVKSDGSGFTQVEPLKGGISGALKRAAVQLGIGRYLYDLPDVIVEVNNKKFYGEIILPDKFLPIEERTGNDEVKVNYKKSSFTQPVQPSTPATSDEVAWAMSYVVHDDKYNNGKKMSEVWQNSLVFLAKSKDPEQAKAARIVAGHKGIAI